MGRIHRHEIGPILISIDAHVDDAGRGEPPFYSHFLTAPRHTYFFPFGGCLLNQPPVMALSWWYWWWCGVGDGTNEHSFSSSPP